jgi:hypothetical protein
MQRDLRESNYLYYEHYRDVEQRMMLNIDDIYIKIHINHCINYLRQILMCNTDTGLVFTYWIDGHEEPHADFNSLRVCRNFTQARDWAQLNGMSFLGPISRRPGQVDLLRYPKEFDRDYDREFLHLEPSEWYNGET